MAVHDLLRELVETRGAGVVGDADQFRGALDDFLDEREATRGEINLLVDAVRLGAVTRVVTMLDHGADPAAALDEVALELARDRGADGTAGARWALGVITYALGKVGAEQVPSRGGGVAAPAPAPSPPSPPAAPAPAPDPPVPAPAAAPGPPTEPLHPTPERPPAPPTEEISTGTPVAADSPTGTLPEPPGPATETLPSYGRPAAAPVRPAAPPAAHPVAPARPRRGRALVVAAAVLLVVGGGAVAAVVLTGDDPAGSSADDPDRAGDGSDGSDGGDGGDAPRMSEVVPDGVLSATQLVLPVKEGGTNSLYVVDTESGKATQLTTGPDDRLPTVSPDRRTVIYLQGAGSGTGGSLQPHVLDLGTGEDRPLFDDDSPCEFATRPAFSPQGDRLGVNCTDAAGDDAGTFVVGLDGQQIRQVVLDGTPRGALTWYSESEVLYASYDGTDGAPSTIEYIDLDGTSPDQVSAPDGGTDLYPDWSEEQGGVLFQRSATTDDAFGQIWFAAQDLDGGGQGEKELDVGRPAAQPTWSPDGSYVAFLVETDDGERLATAPFADPGDVRVYDEVPGDPGAPAWGSR